MSSWTSSGAVLRRVLTVAFAAVLLFGSGIAASPASAATVPVTTAQELAAAFDAASGDDYVVELGGDITVAEEDPVVALPDGQSVVLDLASYQLDITGASGKPGIGVPTASIFTISDSAGGGRLTVVGGPYHAGVGAAIGQEAGAVTIAGGTVTVQGGERGAGIGGSQGGAGGNITIQGGTVKALGGRGAAGIGGGANGAGGTVIINGGTVTATGGLEGAGIGSGQRGQVSGSVDINAGTVTAQGGTHAAGIGGGSLSAGADVTIGAAAKVTAAPTAAGSAVGAGSGDAGIEFGSLSNAGELTIPTYALLIPDGAEVSNSGTVRLAGGSMNGEGTVINTGRIVNSGAVAETVTVTRHSYLLQFHAEGSEAVPDDQWVYAQTVAMAEASLPAGPSREGYTFTGWYLQADGSGAAVTSSTELGDGSGPTNVPLYAGWQADAVLTELMITSEATELVAGGTAQFTVTGLDQDGQSMDVSAAILTSSNDADQIDAWAVTATKTGDRTITATLGELEATTELTVTAGPPTELTLNVTGDPTVVAGTPTDLTVSAVDQYDNPVDTTNVIITSSIDSDEIDGLTLTPTTTGDRTITATLGELEATTELTVTAGPPTELSLSVTGDSTVLAGTPTDLTVSAVDQYGNSVDTTDVIITSSIDSDEIDGLTLTPTTTGDRTITATLGELEATTELTVTAGPPTQLTLNVTGDPTVVAGTPTDLTVSAVDQYDNPVDTTNVIITSSIDSDEIDGLTLTPTTTGDRTITATLGELEATATVLVTAGAPAELTVWIEEGQNPAKVGGSVTLGASATDAYGNPVDASGVVITSSVATDVVDGLTVQFPTASPHVLTASLGEITATMTIEVAAAAGPTPTPGEDAPPDDTDTSTPGEDAPSDDTDTPAPGEDAPTDDTQTPTPGEDAPTDDTDTSGTETPGAVPPGGGQHSGQMLPATGSDAGLVPALGMAVLLLLAGSMLLIGRRRRTT